MYCSSDHDTLPEPIFNAPVFKSLSFFFQRQFTRVIYIYYTRTIFFISFKSYKRVQGLVVRVLARWRRVQNWLVLVIELCNAVRIPCSHITSAKLLSSSSPATTTTSNTTTRAIIYVYTNTGKLIPVDFLPRLSLKSDWR